MTKTISIHTLRQSLLTRFENGTSWAEMGREYDLNPATLWRIVHDRYEPKRKDIRQKLGLPDIITQTAHRDKLGRFTKVD